MSASARATSSHFPGYYETADAGYRDEDGYLFVMARTDDIINVAGHRLSTGAMEEVLASHPDVAECAVLGIKDAIKGQVPLGLVVMKAGVARDTAAIEAECVQRVRDAIGAVAGLKTVIAIKRLPKTRSGKICAAPCGASPMTSPGSCRRPSMIRRSSMKFPRFCRSAALCINERLKWMRRADMTSLDGRVALITGGGNGIGRACAERFARDGAKVAVADIVGAEGQGVASALRDAGHEAVFLQCDVTSSAEVRATVEGTLGAFGAIDILVNNAGIIKGIDFLEISEADFDAVLSVNLQAAPSSWPGRCAARW